MRLRRPEDVLSVANVHCVVNALPIARIRPSNLKKVKRGSHLTMVFVRGAVSAPMNAPAGRSVLSRRRQDGVEVTEKNDNG